PVGKKRTSHIYFCNTNITNIVIHCGVVFLEICREECRILNNLYEEIGPYSDIKKYLLSQKKELYNLIYNVNRMQISLHMCDSLSRYIPLNNFKLIIM
ncbi:Uncharacterized protein FWK35_00012617, partial [Aphis craccivora]